MSLKHLYRHTQQVIDLMPYLIFREWLAEKGSSQACSLTTRPL